MNKQKLPEMYSLQVSENGRFLEKSNGDPFSWLGDTGWRLFAKLDREVADRYLEDRQKKGFTVIQCHILPWNLDEGNACGNTLFMNRNIHQPVMEYWQHVDYILSKSEELGLYMAVLPAWGRTFIETRLGKPEDKIFTDNPSDAYDYGLFLGERYRENDWLLVLDQKDAGCDIPGKQKNY